VLQGERYIHIFTALFSDRAKSCFRHIFAEHIVTKWELIFELWRRFLLKTYQITKTSLGFLKGIMVKEISSLL
jgi:hypothetical protein